MKIYELTAASFALDARDINGQKIDATIIEGAKYKLSNGASEIFKTLTDGLRIEYSDNLGVTAIFVDIAQSDINFNGRAVQELTYSTDGVNYQGATLRPKFIDIIDRN